MRVSKNKFVTVTYDLHVGDADDRTLMESATPEQPLKFIYGIGAMLEAFEKNLSGLEPGDRFEFSLTPEQAYGQRIEEHMNGSVLEVKDDVVVMDFNHPLAGETLHFAGQVADVHEPTAEELAEMEQMMHGGCGGHDHDGCGGCDGCCH